MSEENKTTLDQIKEYLFTMSEDELFDVLKLIEEYLSSKDSE